MKITLPEGFLPPENARPGEPFEVVAMIQPSEDGSHSLVSLNGMKMVEEDEEMEDEEEPGEDMEKMPARNDGSRISLPF